MLRVRVGKVRTKQVQKHALVVVVQPPTDGAPLHFKPGQFLTDNPGGFIIELFDNGTVMVVDEAVPRDLHDPRPLPPA